VVSTPRVSLNVKALVAEESTKPAVPEVEVSDSAPVVKVKPLDAVRVEENLPVPVTSKAKVVGFVFPIPTFPEMMIPLEGAVAL
jgi:hypothetical protein